MGFFSKLFGKKESGVNAGIMLGSSGGSGNPFEAMGFKVVDLRSDSEKNAEKSAAQPLESPLEQYANDIVRAFASYDGNSDASDNAAKAKIRPIGEKLNDNQKQLRVFHRAKYNADAGTYANTHARAACKFIAGMGRQGL